MFFVNLGLSVVRIVNGDCPIVRSVLKGKKKTIFIVRILMNVRMELKRVGDMVYFIKNSFLT